MWGGYKFSIIVGGSGVQGYTTVFFILCRYTTYRSHHRVKQTGKRLIQLSAGIPRSQIAVQGLLFLAALGGNNSYH